MDLGLKDKVCVVMASNRGLGLAAATALLEEGARVALSGRDAARNRELEAELAARFGERAAVATLDVTDAVALSRHVDATRERFGGLHVLVTNGGGPPPCTALDTTAGDVQAAMFATLGAPLVAIQAALPTMRAQRWGRIVAMTSTSVRQPIGGLALSNTLRAGLTGYLKTLSNEVARDGVLVNGVCTGLFDTDRLRELFVVRARRNGRSIDEERAAAEREIPVGRIGRPEEFGALVAFLASERASYLNGVALAYDGGATRGLL